MDDAREYQPEHDPGHEYQVEQEPGHEYQPEHEPGREYQLEHRPGLEYQPELEPELEYQPENEPGLEYQPDHEPQLEYQPEPPGLDYQPELEAGNEYKPEPEAEEESDPEEAAAGQEYQLDDEAEQGYKPEDENEEEYQPQIEDEPVQQDREHELDIDNDNGTEDGIPEISRLDEKQNNAAETEAVGGEKWPGWPGESVFRMLVPAQKVGSIIGRKGEYIKKTCEETKARIKILDGPPGTRERAVMVSAKEEPDVPHPPAIEGLLQVHKRVLDGLENESSAPAPGSGGKVSTRLLVPAAQAGSLIGKQGTTVKSIQDESNCVVRVLGTEELPVFALQDDRVVEVVGEATGIHKALELIATHLRKFLVDRSIISVIEMQMQTPNPPMEHMPPPPQHWGPPPQSFPPAAHGGYAASPRFMQPSRQQQYDNYYPPGDDKQPHQGISAYGREAQIMHSSSAQTPSSVITQITQQMQIPLLYADAVIGTQGATISYIRRISGATVTIQETRGVPTEMTVEISGTASQVQAAQQLIQNFMADAQGSTQQQNPPSAEQMYGSYVAHGSAPNPSQSGGYGSVYGNSYGY